MASVLIGNSCQTQTLQGLGRMGVPDISMRHLFYQIFGVAITVIGI